jgi:cytochrome o ubiquinol oxidase subunit 2
MSRKTKIILSGLILSGFILAAAVKISSTGIAILQPSGAIGRQERDLIVLAVLLSLVVVIPVYAMLIGFSLKYRESNKKSAYEPKLDGSRLFESIWWGVPLVLIIILSVVTWRSSQTLDPFRKLDSSRPPLDIQVVALQWKWLFIYPKQDIATVNYVQFPINSPVRFTITSDAPMNSFWIPKLGGQIYAMSGMKTQLNLEADKSGSYEGMSANLSGQGFAGMKFKAQASSSADFAAWVNQTKQVKQQLDMMAYNHLAQPSSNQPVGYFGALKNDVFNSVVNKYLQPVYLTHGVSE